MATGSVSNRVVLPRLPGASAGPVGPAPSAFARAVADIGRIDGPLIASRHRPAPDVQALSDVLGKPTAERNELAGRLRHMLRTGDTKHIPEITARMVDMSAQSDLVAKVVGKTVSAVDQLSKLA